MFNEIEKDKRRRQEQAEKGLDGLSYFVLCKLTEDGIPNAEAVSKKIREAFGKHPGWKDGDLGDYVIVHELLHFSVPNHGKLWKSLIRAHLGDYERIEKKLKKHAD